MSEDSTRRQLVFGGQHLYVPAGSALDVDLEVEVLGDRGHVSVRTNLLAKGMQPLYQRDVRGLQPGDRLHTRYTYATHRALDKLEARFIVFARQGRGLKLLFRKARLRVRSAPEMLTRDESRLDVHELQIDRRS